MPRCPFRLESTGSRLSLRTDGEFARSKPRARGKDPPIRRALPVMRRIGGPGGLSTEAEQAPAAVRGVWPLQAQPRTAVIPGRSDEFTTQPGVLGPDLRLWPRPPRRRLSIAPHPGAACDRFERIRPIDSQQLSRQPQNSQIEPVTLELLRTLCGLEGVARHLTRRVRSDVEAERRPGFSAVVGGRRQRPEDTGLTCGNVATGPLVVVGENRSPADFLRTVCGPPVRSRGLW